jgi:hypothetical protein
VRYIYTEHDIGPRWAVWAPSWATIFRGGPYSVPASKNEFTEAGILRRPPRFMLINRDGCFRTTASVNVLMEAVALGQPPG